MADIFARLSYVDLPQKDLILLQTGPKLIFMKQDFIDIPVAY